MIAKRVLFFGRVQGVGFRYSVKQLALSYEVLGTVENLPDGSVQVLVTGDPAEVEPFVEAIRTESEVSHFIKEHRIMLTSPFQAKGFTIKR